MVSQSRDIQLFAQGKEYKVDHFQSFTIRKIQNGGRDAILNRTFFIYVIDSNETQMCPLQEKRLQHSLGLE